MPNERCLDAVARLAQMALRVSGASRQRTPGELRYLEPLRLTQSVVHAGHDEYRETPGRADWHSWLGTLLGATCQVVEEAHMCDVVGPDPDPAISPGSLHRDRGEAMELAARSLLTTCVQTLALFGSPQPSARVAP